MSYKAVCIPDKNTMNFYNISEGEVKLDCAPIKYDVDEIENPNFYQELGLSVLTPIMIVKSLYIGSYLKINLL